MHSGSADYSEICTMVAVSRFTMPDWLEFWKTDTLKAYLTVRNDPARVVGLNACNDALRGGAVVWGVADIKAWQCGIKVIFACTNTPNSISCSVWLVAIFCKIADQQS